MIIEKKHKSSFHKANARYRGVTEHSQYTNFMLETAHDLVLLSNLMTGNEALSQKGHEKEIKDNFVSVMNGDQGVGRSNLFTASTLLKIDKDRKVAVPLLDSWSKLNGAQLTKAGSIYKLTSQGLLDPSGVYSTVYTEPGDKIYMRLKIRSTTGAPAFSFGSNNVRISPERNGDTKKVSIPKGQDYMVLDHVIRFGYADSVSLNINLHENPATLKATEIELKDLEIYYIKESPIQLAPYHTVIKPGLDEMEEKINSIR